MKKPHWTSTKQGIRWTGEERDMIIGLVVSEFADIKDALTDNMIFQSICKAQQIFPKDRQRPAKAPSNFPSLIDQCRKEVIRYRIERHSLQNASTPAPVAAPAKVDTGSFLGLISQMFDLAVDKAAERIAQKIKPAAAPVVDTAQIAEAVAELLEKKGYVLTSTEPSQELKDAVAEHPKTEAPAVNDPQPAPVKSADRRVRIGVLGLIGHQQTVVAKRFPDISFKFYSKGYPKQAANVDYMLGMTGFMRHATDEKAIEQFGSHYVRISGGISTLENTIENLAKTLFNEASK